MASSICDWGRSAGREGDFPATEKAGRTSIAIPLHNNLTPEEVEYVAQVLEEGIRTT